MPYIAQSICTSLWIFINPPCRALTVAGPGNCSPFGNDYSHYIITQNCKSNNTLSLCTILTFCLLDCWVFWCLLKFCNRGECLTCLTLILVLTTKHQTHRLYWVYRVCAYIYFVLNRVSWWTWEWVFIPLHGWRKRDSMVVFLSCHNKVPQAGRLKQQKKNYSQFWKLEDWNQGVCRVSFFWGLFPWQVDSYLLTVSLHDILGFSREKINRMYVYVCVHIHA